MICRNVYWYIITKWTINLMGPSDWRRVATEIWFNIGLGNGLLPDGMKPLPELILTCIHISQL